MDLAVTPTAAFDSAVPVPVSLPLREILPWAIYGALLFVLLVYFVGAEQGAFSLISGSTVHELVHDARHLLGFPCH